MKWLLGLALALASWFPAKAAVIASGTADAYGDVIESIDLGPPGQPYHYQFNYEGALDVVGVSIGYEVQHLYYEAELDRIWGNENLYGVRVVYGNGQATWETTHPDVWGHFDPLTFLSIDPEPGSFKFTIEFPANFDNCVLGQNPEQICALNFRRFETELFARMEEGNRYTISEIPEPATWLMMITGFGMIGYMMRLRNQIASPHGFGQSHPRPDRRPRALWCPRRADAGTTRGPALVA